MVNTNSTNIIIIILENIQAQVTDIMGNVYFSNIPVFNSKVYCDRWDHTVYVVFLMLIFSKHES